MDPSDQGYYKLDRIQELTNKLEADKEREAELGHQLASLNALWAKRLLPLQEELTAVRKDILQSEQDLAFLDTPTAEPAVPTGPSQLKWVDGDLFFCVTTCVIIVNLVVMYLELHGSTVVYKFIDNVVLIWYVLELVLKTIYFQRGFLCGLISTVWWNWLDLVIVVSSIVDQWLIPLLSSQGTTHFNISFLRALRLLRLVRVLKLLKSVLFADLSWAAGPRFESFIGAVISLNAVIMGMEQDISWQGWAWIEQVLLVIFSFELLVKFKLFGVCGFFTHQELRCWNCLDFAIVSGGILDLWALPAIKGVLSIIGAGSSDLHVNHQTIKLLRLMRIMRVFRLARLVRNVKPLYKLMSGVAEGLSAMFWFVVLVAIILYALSIVFVIMVNDGYVFAEGEVPDAAREMWGTVPHSMYALFKLMNDDQSVVESISGTVVGVLLFISVMMISNWALLAILTSVVSDSMLSSSARCDEADKEDLQISTLSTSRRQLLFLFQEIDTDRLGFIDEEEWVALLDDPQKGGDLEAALGCDRTVLQQLFESVADHNNRNKEGRLTGTTHRVLDYHQFIKEAVLFNKDHWESLALMNRLRSMDRRIAERLDHLIEHQEENGEITERLANLITDQEGKDTFVRTVSGRQERARVRKSSFERSPSMFPHNSDRSSKAKSAMIKISD